MPIFITGFRRLCFKTAQLTKHRYSQWQSHGSVWEFRPTLASNATPGMAYAPNRRCNFWFTLCVLDHPDLHYGAPIYPSRESEVVEQVTEIC